MDVAPRYELLTLLTPLTLLTWLTLLTLFILFKLLYTACPQPWQAFTPPGKRGKKVPQAILASLYFAPPPPLRAMPTWK